MFVTTLTEKLLTYALGRGVEYTDAPAIRAITRAAARDGHRFSSLILGVIESPPYRNQLTVVKRSGTRSGGAATGTGNTRAPARCSATATLRCTAPLSVARSRWCGLLVEEQDAADDRGGVFYSNTGKRWPEIEKLLLALGARHRSP